MHGYQLRVAFEESTGGTWPLNIGQVYSTLSRLERDGLVRRDELAIKLALALTTPGAEASRTVGHVIIPTVPAKGPAAG